MDYALALIYFAVLCALLWRMWRVRNILTTQLGVLALFSIAYYPFPVLLKSFSSLRDQRADDIFVALLIHFLFLLALLIGAFVASHWKSSGSVLRTRALDAFLLRNKYKLAFICFIIWIAYFTTNTVTTYAQGNLEAFYNKQNSVTSLLSALSELAVAGIALVLGIELSAKRYRTAILLGGAIGSIAVMSFSTGTRLLIISPILAAFVGMLLVDQKRNMKYAVASLAAAAITLVLVSPLLTYIRYHLWEHTSKGSVMEAATGFSYGDDPVTRLVSGVVERADLISVTVNMKKVIDETGFANLQYYYSVLVSPIPRILYPNKPTALSTDGTPYGELSIWAYSITTGGLGSLTAFGGLVAYREAGWLGILLNGLATGALFAFLARWLGKGGFIAQMIYINLFISVTVAKAPAGFFESLTIIGGTLPVLVSLILISVLMSTWKRTHVRSSTVQVGSKYWRDQFRMKGVMAISKPPSVGGDYEGDNIIKHSSFDKSALLSAHDRGRQD